MPDTLADIRNEVLRYLRGDLDSDDDKILVNATINDSIESIWMAMIQAKLNRFIGKDSPVTFQLAANTERVRLISVTDPAIAPLTFQNAGGVFAQRNVSAAYTYVTESGSETLPSPISAQVVNANNLLFVQLPGVQANILNAIGWNVYCVVAPDAVLSLQNQDPIPFNIGWQEPPSGIVDYPVSQQTVPLVNSTGDNISWIKHLEVRTSDTLLRAWNQSDIDSAMFRQFAQTLGSASEYQTYMWDLINGNQLEIRPQTGLAFTGALAPRYFYIAKPRRLRYDQATVPYTEITGVHAYVVRETVSILKLVLDEYLAHQAYGALADKEQMKILTALLQEDWSRDTRISPHVR
jgi:hypothetical protein